MQTVKQSKYEYWLRNPVNTSITTTIASGDRKRYKSSLVQLIAKLIA